MIAGIIPYVTGRTPAVCRCLNQSKGGGGKAGLVSCPRDQRMIGPVKVSPEANLAAFIMRKVTGHRPPLSAGGNLHGRRNGKPGISVAGDHGRTGDPVTANRRQPPAGVEFKSGGVTHLRRGLEGRRRRKFPLLRFPALPLDLPAIRHGGRRQTNSTPVQSALGGGPCACV